MGVHDCRSRQLLPDFEVWAFGSRVTGTARPFSDLDIAVIGEAPLPLSLMSELNEAFSESDLPWKVDLVDWALTSPAFRKIIEARKVVLQSRGKSAGKPRHKPASHG